METDLIRVLASMTAVIELLLAKGVIEPGEFRDAVARQVECVKHRLPD